MSSYEHVFISPLHKIITDISLNLTISNILISSLGLKDMHSVLKSLIVRIPGCPLYEDYLILYYYNCMNLAEPKPRSTHLRGRSIVQNVLIYFYNGNNIINLTPQIAATNQLLLGKKPPL